MTQGTDQLRHAFRPYTVDGIPASGEHEPEKAEIRAAVDRLGVELGAAQAGLTTVPDIAARDAFFSDAENQGKLVYVNDNNGDPEDPDNGVYEYVDGAARLATGFYQGVATVVQPLVDEAEGYAVEAAASATVMSALTSDFDIGRSVTPVTGNAVGNYTYVFSDPIPANGYLDAFSIYVPSGSGTIKIRRFIKDGDNFSQVGSDLDLSVSVGLNSFSLIDLGEWPVNAGERLGFYTSGLIAYNLTTGDSGGYYAASGDQTSFTDSTVTTNVRIEVSFGLKVLDIPGADDGEAIAAQRVNGSSGVHGYVGRMEYSFSNTTPQTFRLLQAVPARFDAVRVILSHATAVDVVVEGCQVAALGAPAEFDSLMAGDFVDVTFGGSTIGRLPAKGGKPRAFLRSDIIRLSSVARTDAGTNPLVAVSAYISTPTTLVLNTRSDNLIDRSGWATALDREWIARHDEGDCVSNPAAFTETANDNYSPIVAIEFLSHGQIVYVASFGDSIANGEGAGITLPGASFVHEACRSLSDIDGVVYSHANMAWSGAAMATFPGQMRAAFEAGLAPDIAVIPAYSPNSANVPLTATNIAEMERDLAEMLELCRQYNVKPLIWTGLPTNASQKDFGSSDSLRRDYNDRIRALASQGMIVSDLAALLAGVIDPDGQEEMLAGSTSDGIHPDDSGIAAMTPPTENGILAWNMARVGSLVVA